jgi:2-polyprenyl-3-methyl-5-hydroxy-6-metoxy-1,4-benzoquinol methylase
MARLTFALRMMKERWNRERSLCPYCEALFSIRLQRKWMLIEARQCIYCGLIYRWPTDPTDGVRDFYEDGYEGQQATDLPSPSELERMVSQNFASTQFDKHDRGVFLNRTLGAADGRKLLDFGCSWGYSVWQYQAAGYRACGFELDRHRASYGREHLRLDVRSSLEDFRDPRFDIILADHALEHVPRPGVTLDSLAKLAGDASILVVFVPNGSCAAARRLGVSWGPFIGEAHTVAFTMDWFSRNLARHGWNAVLYDSAGMPLPRGEYLTDHDEICVVARRSSAP